MYKAPNPVRGTIRFSSLAEATEITAFSLSV